MEMKLYPLLLKPIVKKMIWGQESWDVTCRPNEMSVIENGAYAGMAFDAYLNIDRMKTLGTRLADLPRFPLLVKIITAIDTLSVQVHPDDDYAKKQNNSDSGKSEMWYILTPPTDGKLIIGLRDGVTKERFKQMIETGDVTEALHYLPVKTGDMVNIPAGLIHALTPGTTLAEIQQNSDTTYRLYDYNRPGPDGKPRELHVEQALDVTDFDRRIPVGITEKVHGKYFIVEQYDIDKTHTFASEGKSFNIAVCVEGTVSIAYDGGEVKLDNRRTAFLPAGMGAFTFIPKSRAKILLCTVPADTQYIM
jgi:mannose-6-phosphate isomerase